MCVFIILVVLLKNKMAMTSNSAFSKLYKGFHDAYKNKKYKGTPPTKLTIEHHHNGKELEEEAVDLKKIMDAEGSIIWPEQDLNNFEEEEQVKQFSHYVALIYGKQNKDGAILFRGVHIYINAWIRIIKEQAIAKYDANPVGLFAS